MQQNIIRSSMAGANAQTYEVLHIFRRVTGFIAEIGGVRAAPAMFSAAAIVRQSVG